MQIKERFEKVIEWFKVNMPVAESELNYRSPYELLVAVILSAQCTDKRVNLITPELLRRFHFKPFDHLLKPLFYLHGVPFKSRDKIKISFVDFRVNFAAVILIVYDLIPASRKSLEILGRITSF